MGPMKSAYEALKEWKSIFRVPFTSSLTGERLDLTIFEKLLEPIEKPWGKYTPWLTSCVENEFTGEAHRYSWQMPARGEFALWEVPGLPKGVCAKLLCAKGPLSFQLHPDNDEVWFPEEGALYLYEDENGRFPVVVGEHPHRTLDDKGLPLTSPEAFISKVVGKTRGPFKYPSSYENCIDKSLEERRAKRGQFIPRGRWHQLLLGEVIEVRTQREAITYRKVMGEPNPPHVSLVQSIGPSLRWSEENFRYEVFDQQKEFVGSFRYTTGVNSALVSPEPMSYELQLSRRNVGFTLRTSVPEDMDLTCLKAQWSTLDEGHAVARLGIVLPHGEGTAKVAPKYVLGDLPVIGLTEDSPYLRAALTVKF